MLRKANMVHSLINSHSRLITDEKIWYRLHSTRKSAKFWIRDCVCFHVEQCQMGRIEKCSLTFHRMWIVRCWICSKWVTFSILLYVSLFQIIFFFTFLWFSFCTLAFVRIKVDDCLYCVKFINGICFRFIRGIYHIYLTLLHKAYMVWSKWLGQYR